MKDFDPLTDDEKKILKDSLSSPKNIELERDGLRQRCINLEQERDSLKAEKEKLFDIVEKQMFYNQELIARCEKLEEAVKVMRLVAEKTYSMTKEWGHEKGCQCIWCDIEGLQIEALSAVSALGIDNKGEEK
jgi:hypothetical protein